MYEYGASYTRPEDVDTIQVTFDLQGRVLRYWTYQESDGDPALGLVTQLLWNVDGGNGHITVMLGGATPVLQRLKRLTASSGIPEEMDFGMLYYGMDSSGTQEGLEGVTQDGTLAAAQQNQAQERGLGATRNELAAPDVLEKRRFCSSCRCRRPANAFYSTKTCNKCVGRKRRRHDTDTGEAEEQETVEAEGQPFAEGYQSVFSEMNAERYKIRAAADKIAQFETELRQKARERTLAGEQEAEGQLRQLNRVPEPLDRQLTTDRTVALFARSTQVPPMTQGSRPQSSDLLTTHQRKRQRPHGAREFSFKSECTTTG